MAYSMKFVDSITSSPTTRLDVSSGSWELQRDGTDLSPPPLRRAVVSTLLTDGERIPAAAYGNRVIRLRLRCLEPTDDAAATAVQNLARELDRPSNFLRYQTDTTEPVYFRTSRADFNAIDWDPFAKYATVTIPAEPFAYGPVETLPSVTVYNDPAAASNGCYLDVSGVKGDVETPLILAFDANVLTANPSRITSAIAVRRRGTPSNVPFVRQAEALTLGTDTTLPGNDVAMSGTGSNYAQVSFATDATMVGRLSGYVTGSGLSESTDYRGTYRVYGQVRHSAAGDDIAIRLLWGFAPTASVTNDTVTLPAETELGLVDLGLIQMPTGADPVHDGMSGVEMTVPAAWIEVDAQRVSGTGTLDIDYLLLVPADDRLLLVKWPTFTAGTGDPRFVVDGGHEMVYASDISLPDVSTTIAAEVAGGFPMVSPNETNRVFFVRQVDNTSQADAVTGTTTVTPWYYPRYLYVRPVLT